MGGDCCPCRRTERLRGTDLIVPARPEHESVAQNGSEQETLHKKLAVIIAEAENLESEPGKPLRDPLEAEWGAAVEEKYRKMGFKF